MLPVPDLDDGGEAPLILLLLFFDFCDVPSLLGCLFVCLLPCRDEGEREREGEREGERGWEEGREGEGEREEVGGLPLLVTILIPARRSCPLPLLLCPIPTLAAPTTAPAPASVLLLFVSTSAEEEREALLSAEVDGLDEALSCRRFGVRSLLA